MHAAPKCACCLTGEMVYSLTEVKCGAELAHILYDCGESVGIGDKCCCHKDWDGHITAEFEYL